MQLILAVSLLLGSAVGNEENTGKGNGRRQRTSGANKLPALMPGISRPNKNLNSLNNHQGIGCKLKEIASPYVAAIGAKLLKNWLNCGRCIKVTCTGKACDLDEDGNPRFVIAKIVAQTTKSLDSKDVELNGDAWQELMGNKAQLVGQTINWFYTACPVVSGARPRVFIHPQTDPKKLLIQPLDFKEGMKFYKFKSSLPKSKWAKAKDPNKSKQPYYLWELGLKGEMVAPVELFAMSTNKLTKEKLKIKMATWEEGTYAYADGLPPDDVEKGPTKTKNDNMNSHVLGGMFGQVAPAKKPSKKPSKPTQEREVLRPGMGGGAPQRGEGDRQLDADWSTDVAEATSDVHNAIDMFITDMLSPFQVNAPAAPTVKTTTRPITTKVVNFGNKQTISGWGAPSDPRFGSCRIPNPMDRKIYLALNNKLDPTGKNCGMCAFVFCPPFSDGCVGGVNAKPIKAQIIGTFSGSADLALSKEGFKQVSGWKGTGAERKKVLTATFKILPC